MPTLRYRGTHNAGVSFADLEIHFDHMHYEVTEGDGNKDVIFYHRTTEEDFTLTVTPVEASEVMHMGGRMAHENICPAKKGAVE